MACHARYRSLLHFQHNLWLSNCHDSSYGRLHLRPSFQKHMAWTPSCFSYSICWLPLWCMLCYAIVKISVQIHHPTYNQQKRMAKQELLCNQRHSQTRWNYDHCSSQMYVDAIQYYKSCYGCYEPPTLPILPWKPFIFNNFVKLGLSRLQFLCSI